MKFKRIQIFPSTGDLEMKQIPNDKLREAISKPVKKWADRMVHALDGMFREIASIPFNQSESISVADTGDANTEFSVTHHLDRVPVGFFVTNTDKAVSVYDSGTAWTSTTIYLKANVANAAITISVL
jgi:hypothetical protein